MNPPLVVWTARLAVMGWLACWIVRCGCRPSSRRDAMSRWLWTCSWLVYVAHVAAAFALVHHWSHAAAFEHTARETQAIVGWNWGGGLWFNYAFTLVWTMDVLRMWASPTRLTRPSRMDWTIQLYLAFIVLNATLVFGPRWWWGVFTLAVVVVMGVRRVRSPEPG